MAGEYLKAEAERFAGFLKASIAEVRQAAEGDAEALVRDMREKGLIKSDKKSRGKVLYTDLSPEELREFRDGNP